MNEPETVTIPWAEYRDLLICRRQLAEAGIRQSAFSRPSRSPIERDPEVAFFIANRLGTWTIKQIRDQCRRHLALLVPQVDRPFPAIGPDFVPRRPLEGFFKPSKYREIPDNPVK